MCNHWYHMHASSCLSRLRPNYRDSEGVLPLMCPTWTTGSFVIYSLLLLLYARMKHVGFLLQKDQDYSIPDLNGLVYLHMFPPYSVLFRELSY